MIIVPGRTVVRTLVVLLSALLVSGLALLAQRMTPPGKYISAAQWAKALDADKPSLGVVAGQSTTIVPTLVIRRRLDGPNNASVHTAEIDQQDVTEIYYITSRPATSS